MGQVETLIPQGVAPSETALSAPGEAFGALSLNFAEPAAEPFHVRLLEAGPDGMGPMVEVQQGHRNGVGWATLEFPVTHLPAGTRIRFEARLLPARTVVLAVYAPGVGVDIAQFEVGHRLAGYEAVVEAALADRLEGAEWIRLGLTLPRGTWFVFQLAGAGLDFTAEGVA